MDIRQFRVVLRARSFEKTCRFYGEVLALPRLQAWEADDLRGELFQAGSGVVEVRGRRSGAAPGARDEAFDYTGPQHKLTLNLEVPDAQKAYEELHFRETNIPGGLRRDVDGSLVFESHDPDGVKVVFRQSAA